LKVGLPSFSWGAGLNLYNFGPVAYFLNRIGTYRVDRRKKNPIYLNVLKNMSTLSMERGVHSLFYPGGTRSRSGEVDQKCKLGLLGTTIEAQRRIGQQGGANKIFVVPLILDYHFVLEGKFLIEQYLQEIGGEHYAAIRDESRSKRKLLKFLLQFYRESSEIVMSLGEPFDVLGNFVNDQGESLSDDGSIIDVYDYFRHDGEITEDPQRERVYTTILADRIVERYLKDNVVLSSHVIAFTAFQMIREKNRDLDIMGLLKLPLEDFRLTRTALQAQVGILIDHLKGMEERKEVRLSEPLKWELEDVTSDGIQKLGLYHEKKPLVLKGDHIHCQNVKLLFYYHNRLKHYGLEDLVTGRQPAITSTLSAK
nr:glycerol acyltransferase [Saprospiraceae bacterium]